MAAHNGLASGAEEEDSIGLIYRPRRKIERARRLSYAARLGGKLRLFLSPLNARAIITRQLRANECAAGVPFKSNKSEFIGRLIVSRSGHTFVFGKLYFAYRKDMCNESHARVCV